MAAASVCVPRASRSCFLPLQETFEDQQVGLVRDPRELQLLPLVPERGRLCVCPLRGKSFFPPVLWNSRN